MEAVMKPRLIVIDGKTYNSVNEMPADVRQKYEQAMSTFKDQDGNRIPDSIENNNMLADNDRNGIPDIMENTPGAPIIANAIKVLVDGKAFNSLDELPPEARAKYEQAMGALDANRNGIPDFVEGMMAGTEQQEDHASRHSESHTTHHAPRQPMPYTPTIEPDRSNGWLLALLAGLLLFLCAAAGAVVWYFFLR
jgi:hypothetical protein